MKIELTKDQYKTLLLMTYCGEWMLNSYKIKEDKISKNSDELLQFIYSFAEGYGFGKWIEFDTELQQYFPTADMEDDLHKFVDKYNEKQLE